jgi:phage terminase small subunit
MPSGRRSFTTLDAELYGAGRRRLRPPDSLGELEKRVFVDLVSQCPLEQFTTSDLPLICRWCELTVMAERAACELAAAGPVTADGKRSPWWAIHREATKGLVMLAMRLRLSPQSRSRKAPKTQAARLSAYEKMALAEDDDEADKAPLS